MPVPAALPDFQHLRPGWRSLSGDAAAGWHAQQFGPVVEHDGVMWTYNTYRFYTPLDQVAAAAEEARPPSGPRLGYWVTTTPGAASSWVPAELVVDLPKYAADRLPGKDARYRVRRAARKVECIAVTDPEILLAQGWELEAWAAARSGKPIAASVQDYRRQIVKRFETDPQLIVAAVDGDELLGYMASHAIGTMLRMTEIVVAERGRDLDVGILLYWATLQRATTVPGLRAAHLGPWYPERPNLRYTKSRLGVELMALPVRGHLSAPARPLLRRIRPVKYARLGGGDFLDHPDLRDLRTFPALPQ